MYLINVYFIPQWLKKSKNKIKIGKKIPFTSTILHKYLKLMQKFIHFKKWIKCPHLTQESRYAWENECSGCESFIFLKKKNINNKTSVRIDSI